MPWGIPFEAILFELNSNFGNSHIINITAVYKYGDVGSNNVFDDEDNGHVIIKGVEKLFDVNAMNGTMDVKTRIAARQGSKVIISIGLLKD